MGAFDYEKSKEEKVADTTRNERTSKNTVYLLEYGKYTTASRGFIANVLNRPVYTYTKLREDIFYIHCRLFTENDSLNYIFIVNEKSFWKRFTVLHNGIKIIKNDENLVLELPNDADYSNKNGEKRITLKKVKNEL